MSVASPTLVPHALVFPRLLPKPPQPYPTPLPRRRVYAYLNSRRDIQREMDDLSDEENEVEDVNVFIRNRGYNTMIPIGRLLTQQEEKNDADETEDSDSAHSGGPPSAMEEDGENESAADLDASMEDMDEAGNTTAETDEADGDGDTEEDEPASDM